MRGSRQGEGRWLGFLARARRKSKREERATRARRKRGRASRCETRKWWDDILQLASLDRGVPLRVVGLSAVLVVVRRGLDASSGRQEPGSGGGGLTLTSHPKTSDPIVHIMECKDCYFSTLYQKVGKHAKRKEQGESSSSALITKKQERRGRSHSRNSHGYRGRSKSKRDIKCFHCNRPSHIKKECRFWKREQNERKKNEKKTNSVAAEGDIIIVYDDGCVSLAAQDSNWVIDSGAPFYVTSHAKLHKGEINAIQKGESIDLWHKRLGRISEKGLQALVRKQFLAELQVPPPIVHDDYGGDDDEEYGDNVSDDTLTVNKVELTEQAPPPLVEIPLRRSTRERQPSIRYLPHEYEEQSLAANLPLHLLGVHYLKKKERGKKKVRKYLQKSSPATGDVEDISFTWSLYNHSSKPMIFKDSSSEEKKMTPILQAQTRRRKEGKGSEYE
ncbi:hypothetical protein MUK42_34390 [Musa troglodytarum]|uniref:CCHC-type domain-containing protein n=1 Tax=Musa troglodytarum TaxID=320322 RepID=A0A9E7JDC3_9LILI|nr:hypothetical protein MUK42_34390 [Musa troglodytarum]